MWSLIQRTHKLGNQLVVHSRLQDYPIVLLPLGQKVWSKVRSRILKIDPLLRFGQPDSTKSSDEPWISMDNRSWKSQHLFNFLSFLVPSSSPSAGHQWSVICAQIWVISRHKRYKHSGTYSSILASDAQVVTSNLAKRVSCVRPSFAACSISNHNGMIRSLFIILEWPLSSGEEPGGPRNPLLPSEEKENTAESPSVVFPFSASEVG